MNWLNHFIQCSVSCGKGVKTRYVHCMYNDKYDVESRCQEVAKPETEAECMWMCDEVGANLKSISVTVLGYYHFYLLIIILFRIIIFPSGRRFFDHDGILQSGIPRT